MKDIETKPDAIRFYRRVVAIETGYKDIDNEDWEANFEDYLLRKYQEIQGIPGKLGSYILAVGLITYGHLDVVKHLFDPDLKLPVEAGSRHLVKVTKLLIPFPEDLDVLQDREQVTRWIDVHKDHLLWNPEAKCFKLLEPDE